MLCQVNTSASWHHLNAVPSQDFCSSLKTCTNLLGLILVSLRADYNRLYLPHPEGIMCTRLDVIHEENKSVRTCKYKRCETISSYTGCAVLNSHQHIRFTQVDTPHGLVHDQTIGKPGCLDLRAWRHQQDFNYELGSVQY